MARLLASRHHCEGQLLAIGQDVQQQPRLLALGVGLGAVLPVDQSGAVQGEGERPST
jgi:hypothetical protein